VPSGTIVRVRFRDKKQFENCWIKDISHGGIFLRTHTPAPLFARLVVALELPTGDVIEVAGEVVRLVKPEQASAGVAAGMGVQFTDLSAEKREKLEAFLGHTLIGVPAPVESRPPSPATPGALTAAAAPVGQAAPPSAASVRAPASAPTLVGDRSVSGEAPPAAPAPSGVEEMAQTLRRLLWLCGDAAALGRADYYGVLGVLPSSRVERIREVCGFVRALLDPTGVPDHVPPASAKRFEDLALLLGKIETTLCDPKQRAAYDHRRAKP
jgi:uncharacterized protein (TIGR02266 family)